MQEIQADWRLIMALFVLGAGATRGSSFVDAKQEACLPPLDADFFTQLQRVSNAKHQNLITAVLCDVVELFGQNFSVTMETVFTTLEHTLRMIETIGDTRAFKKAPLQEKRRRLLQAVALVLEASCTVRDKAGVQHRTLKECNYHSALVEKVLMIGDDIISFNYDCVLDDALRKHGGGKWNSERGYGLPYSRRGKPAADFLGWEKWQAVPEASKSAAIHLFKLHGSLHFKFNEKKTPWKVELKERPYTKQKGDLTFSIIPPEWHKAYDQGTFALLWKQAALSVRKMEHFVFIGYSAPPTDLHSTALLRTSVRPQSIKSLAIVNPDHEARRRIRNVLQRGLSPTSRVLSFGSLEEFVNIDRRLWCI
jgi:SIR2-like domain